MTHDGLIGDAAIVDAAEEAALKASSEIGWFESLWLESSAWVVANPMYSGAIAGVVLMVAVYALRRVLWGTVKYVASVPLAVFGALAAPIRRWKQRRKVSRRLPMLGETAMLGPCYQCGTKREYRVKVTGYYGGTVKGYDVTTGTGVMGCASCCAS